MGFLSLLMWGIMGIIIWSFLCHQLSYFDNMIRIKMSLPLPEVMFEVNINKSTLSMQNPWYQKPRTKLSVLLLLLLQDCCQIFITSLKSLQASQNICLCSVRYRICCGGWVAIVVVVCGKICGKIYGKICGKCVVKLKNYWIGTKIGVVVDLGTKCRPYMGLHSCQLPGRLNFFLWI